MYFSRDWLIDESVFTDRQYFSHITAARNTNFSINHNTGGGGGGGGQVHVQWNPVLSSNWMYFYYFVNISLWKRAWSFIWLKLNTLHPRILCANVAYNCPRASGGENFQISSMYFCYFVIIPPWKRTWR